MHVEEFIIDGAVCEKSIDTRSSNPPLDRAAKPVTIRMWFRELLGGWREEVVDERATGDVGQVQAIPTTQMVEEETNPEEPVKSSRKDASSVSSSALSRYQFVGDSMDSAAPFAGQSLGKNCIVRVNSGHPAFIFLTELLEQTKPSGCGAEEIEPRYQRLREGTRLLIAAWIEHEQDLSGLRRRRAEEAREDWGRLLRRLVNGDE